jgi:hypothetical protein
VAFTDDDAAGMSGKLSSANQLVTTKKGRPLLAAYTDFSCVHCRS